MGVLQKQLRTILHDPRVRLLAVGMHGASHEGGRLLALRFRLALLAALTLTLAGLLLCRIACEMRHNNI